MRDIKTSSRTSKKDFEYFENLRMKDQKFYDRLKLRLNDSERFLTLLRDQILAHGELHETELLSQVSQILKNLSNEYY